MRLVTTAEMRELDRRTIELGTPGVELMERAGAGIARFLHERHRAACRRGVVVVAGPGNNGGDGFVVARLLAKRGYGCSVVLLGRRTELTGDARVNADRWARARGKVVELADDDAASAALDRALARAGAIVDGVFGTGLARPVEGLAASAIAAVERAARRQAARSTGKPGPPPVVVAIDVPSGLDADRGEPLGCAVRADVTVALGAAKPGLLVPAARPFVGRLEVVDIGLAAEAEAALAPFGEAADAASLRLLVPRRGAAAHKGSAGHLLVVAGSAGKTGAAILCGRAALRGGAGLVTVACPAEVLPVVAGGAAELMTDPTGDFDPAAWQARLEGKGAVVAGPGLGTSREASDLVHWLVANVAVPVVLDADALNALAGDAQLLWRARHGAILTPHPGEMARLVGRSTAEVQRQRVDVARTLARETGAVVVLKGSGTIVAAPDGRWTLNTTGGPILATGGTGDVLAGLTGSLLAQGLGPYDAARLAAFLHGRAGDRLAARLGDAGLLASELADELPLARHELAAGGAGPPGD